MYKARTRGTSFHKLHLVGFFGYSTGKTVASDVSNGKVFNILNEDTFKPAYLASLNNIMAPDGPPSHQRHGPSLQPGSPPEQDFKLASCATASLRRPFPSLGNFDTLLLRGRLVNEGEDVQQFRPRPLLPRLRCV